MFHVVKMGCEKTTTIATTVDYTRKVQLRSFQKPHLFIYKVFLGWLPEESGTNSNRYFGICVHICTYIHTQNKQIKIAILVCVCMYTKSLAMLCCHLHNVVLQLLLLFTDIMRYGSGWYYNIIFPRAFIAWLLTTMYVCLLLECTFIDRFFSAVCM